MDVNINENSPAPQRSIQISEEKIVGFEDEAEKIIHLLTGRTSELDVISIVGMGGLGKTTLATKIFNDSSVISRFDVRVECTISQTYTVKELLSDIYRKATGIKSNSDDIADMLRKFLIGRRYLIFLDDIWDVQAWQDLRLCFPNTGNRSRVMLTTRLEQVARKVKQYTDPYFLRFLKMEERLKLFHEKVFQKEEFPPEFKDVGLQLVRYSKGLPLAIVLISGIILKKQRNVSEWCEVANNLKSHFREVDNESNSVIQLSYCYLPERLRHCLLTTAVLREDEKMGVSRLMLLWMAEGLVQCNDKTRMEEVAEGYLTDLISSSLIMVAKTSFNGKVKYVEIHDLVRDFVINKAKEEKFMQVIGSHNQYQRTYEGEHRVCIHLDINKIRVPKKSLDILLRGMSFGPNHKSIFVTKRGGNFFYYSLSDHRYSFSSLAKLKLLRVLDFSYCFLKDYEDILQSLVHLRYLGMCCEEFVFEWVSHLSDLETLIVNSGSILYVTPHIWKLTKLQHVNMLTGAVHSKIACEEPSSKLENLNSFEGMTLFCELDTGGLIETFPNLQKLTVLVRSVESCELDSFCLRLEVLTQLRSLTISAETDISTTEYCFPSSLEELILRKAHVSTSVASTISVLPNLGRLKLIKCTFEGNKWDVSDVEFRALKMLKFQQVDLTQWHVSETTFPVLEVLVIKDCEELEKVPGSFVDVDTLESIKVIRCTDTLKSSALEIKEEVEEIRGNDNLKVFVYPPYTREEEEETEVEKEDEEEGE